MKYWFVVFICLCLCSILFLINKGNALRDGVSDVHGTSAGTSMVIEERPVDPSHPIANSSKDTINDQKKDGLTQNLVYVPKDGVDPYQDKKNIYKKFPYLKITDQNETRVLYDDAQWETTYQVLTDQGVLQAVFQGLKDQYKGITEENYSFVNIMRIDFIKQSLRLEENPISEFLYDEVVSLLNFFPSSNELDSLSEKAKSEILGDKLDLIYMLEMYDPTGYSQLKEGASEKLLNIILYAEKNRAYHRRFSE